MNHRKVSKDSLLHGAENSVFGLYLPKNLLTTDNFWLFIKLLR